MLYHVLCITNKQIILVDQSENNILDFIKELKSKQEVILNGYFIKKGDIKRLKIVQSDFNYDTLCKLVFSKQQVNAVLMIPDDALVFDSDEVIDVTKNFLGD